ncbi:MAG: energy-coupling factor transporter transmembrane protein EcfT [Lachnospiraceae bacterium]|nr:energy-coupling factor transporter transmembrane protein EcfT [Lachnospiraceae bacterium]
MLNNITLGQFYPADSVIHRLDPRVKIAATILYIVSLFLVNGVVGWVIVIGFFIFITALAKLPAVMVLKGIRAIWILIAITAVCNFFFTQAGVVLVHRGVLTITTTGIHNTVYYTLRLIFLIAGASIMTLTTSPNRLTDGLESALWPLHRIGVPVSEIAMMMSIALRFIPILGEEAEKIKRAQLARGADFDEGGPIKRVRGLAPILVPLFVSSFRRAEDLGLAMEARCYRGGEGRTKLHPLKYARSDYVAYALVLLFFAAVIVIHVLKAKGLML